MKKVSLFVKGLCLTLILASCKGVYKDDDEVDSADEDFKVSSISMPSILTTSPNESNEIDDWAANKGNDALRLWQVWPKDGDIVSQRRPTFTWPVQDTQLAYSVRVQGSSSTQTVSSYKNVLIWPASLTTGSYQWQVGYYQNGQLNWSEPRRFTVASDALTPSIPTSSQLTDMIAQAAQKDYPRTLPVDNEKTRWVRRLETDYAEALRQLYDGADRAIAAILTPEPVLESEVHQAIYTELTYAKRAALAWYITGNADYLSEARRRVNHMVTWSPTGLTGFNADTGEGRNLAAGLATLYDWLYNELAPIERQRLYTAINDRLEPLYRHLFEDNYVYRYPYDSVADLSITMLAGSLVPMIGDRYAHSEWLLDALTYMVHTPTIWGNEDGGFGNGSGYAAWRVSSSFEAWDAIHRALGLNVYERPWIRNAPFYFAYFMPPNSPSYAFGDGAEDSLSAEISTIAHSFFRRLKNTVTAWYASNIPVVDPTDFDLLRILMPSPDDKWGFPNALSNSAIFPSIGQVAMHSNLSDNNRVSIYFKSSPLGTISHNHGDQNSFVIHAGGEALAIDSGYYDQYGSNHWEKWYRQTIAHNAITFDDNQGQVMDDQQAVGKITQFSHTSLGDIVTGDATAAYGGALDRAIRSIAYLRNNTIIVYDSLASSIARQWEWNIHANNEMTMTNQRFEIRSNGQSLCVAMIEGPNSTLSQSSQFTAQPLVSKPAQYHGQFKSINKTVNTEYIMVLQVGGCNQLPTVTKNALFDGWEVRVGQRTVRFYQSGSASIQ